MNTTPSEPFDPHSDAPGPEQPSWGTAPTTPPAGSGSDHTWQQSSQQPPQQPPQQGRPGAAFFDAIRRLGIVRPDDDRRAAGVAAGLARRLDVAPVAVRIGFVVLALLGGIGVLLYGLGWLFLPHPDGRIHAQEVLSGTVTAGFVGALLTVLIGGPHVYGPVLPLAVIAFIVWRIASHRPHRQYGGC